jgi:4-diphosphocytidyl-2-C-methyl-D-erythritol kinase
VASLIFHAPAKLNLFLAITGRRSDGFHDLVSVAAPLGWGDTLRVEPAVEGISLTCDDPAVPRDETNLVLKAAGAFRRVTGWKGGAKIFLEKRIPMGAGLGGGSSDGAATLRALNELAGQPLSTVALEKIAAEIGSDCALFLRPGPVVMRGRGEVVADLPASAAGRLSGRLVLVFKPAFGISTPWAYGQLAAAAPQSYLPAAEAEARLANWIGDAQAPVEALLFNNMEVPAFAKHIALPTLLAQLRERFGLAPRMSGSGSACFAFLPEDAPVEEISGAIRNAWGNTAFVIAERLL